MPCQRPQRAPALTPPMTNVRTKCTFSYGSIPRTMPQVHAVADDEQVGRPKNAEQHLLRTAATGAPPLPMPACAVPLPATPRTPYLALLGRAPQHSDKYCMPKPTSAADACLRSTSTSRRSTSSSLQAGAALPALAFVTRWYSACSPRTCGGREERRKEMTRGLAFRCNSKPSYCCSPKRHARVLCLQPSCV